MYHSHQSIADNIDWFLNNAGLTRAEFRTRWIKYCGMTHTFVHLDLMDADATEKILKITNQSALGSYLWTSNAFVMDYLMFFKTRAWAMNKTQSFINELAANTVQPILLENQGSLKHMLPNVQ
jgi:hypothetical protein